MRTRTEVVVNAPGVRDGVVSGKVGRRGVGAGVGRRLVVAGPDRRADRGYRSNEMRVLLGQQEGPVAAHRDAHCADPLWGRPNPSR